MIKGKRSGGFFGGMFLAAVSISAIVRGAADDPQFEVLVRTGGASGFTSLGRGPSINDLGYAAFTARRSVSGGRESENVYSVQGESRRSQHLMNRVYERPLDGNLASQRFGENVQINNLNQVVSWRQLDITVQQVTILTAGSLPILGRQVGRRLSYAEVWPVDGNVNNPGGRGLPLRCILMGDSEILSDEIQGYIGNASYVQGIHWYILSPEDAWLYPSPYSPVIGVTGLYSSTTVNNLGKACLSIEIRGQRAVASEYPVSDEITFQHTTVAAGPVIPMLADSEFFAFRQSTNASNVSVFLLHRSQNPALSRRVAGPSLGFSSVGLPGISDDGKSVLFYGDLTSTNFASTYGTTVGPGIFVYSWDRRTITRIAGLQDTNDLASDPIVGFESEERPSVNNLGTVVFSAINSQGQKAIFSTVVDVETQSYSAFPVTQIVAAGDEIEGLPGTVQDLAIYDALNNIGEHGEILFWTSTGGTQAIVKLPAQGCPSCQCDPGDVECAVDSLSVKLGLGQTTTSNRSGYLRIKAQEPNPLLASPAGLDVSGDGSFLRLYSADTVTGSNVLRQVKGPKVLADITPETPYRYSVSFHYSWGSKDPVTGLFSPVGDPGSVVVVENPDGGASTNRLRVTRNGSETFLFTFVPSTGGWELLSGIGNGLRTEFLVNLTNGPVRTERRTIRDSSNVIVQQTVNTFQKFSWGEELVETTQNLGPKARIKSFAFYTNQATDGGNYSKLRSVKYPEGHWEYFRDYSGDAVLKQVTQFQSNPYTESAEWPDPDNRSSEVVYSGDLETHIEYLKGKPISKRWRNQVAPGEIGESVATSSGAIAWDDPSNLITRSFTYTTTDGNGARVGRTSKVINPDGTMSVYAYYTESIDDPFQTGGGSAPAKIKTQRTVIWRGQPNHERSAIIDGTQSEDVVDDFGNSIHRREFDIASGALIASETTTARDHFGRATRIEYLDGTYITRDYDCCGLAQETDREGVVTTYSTGDAIHLDLTGSGTPQTYTGSSMTRAGLTTYTINDALGQATHTVIQGSNGALIVQEQRGYNRERNLAWTRDAMDRLTTFTNYVEGPLRMSVTTFPDGSQSIESTYQDGSAFETLGNAVSGMRYVHGLTEDSGVWVQTSTQTYLEANGSISPEYATTYTDFAGRAYKTEFPWPDGNTNAVALRSYNDKGQLVRSTDPDGRTTLYSYNALGELEATALDVANPGVIDFGGTDRLTRSTSLVENSALRSTVVRKTVAETWETNGIDQPTVLQINETSADGTQTWATQYGLTTHTVTAIDRANQRRTVTTTNPDGTSAITVFEQGRQKSITRLDKNRAQVTQTAFAYDQFGRLAAQTDARNGPTIYTYYDDGQPRTITTPDPDPGASGPGKDPQTTSYVYFRDAANGIKTVTTLPDGGVVTLEYFSSGQLKKTWGASTYPAEYTYDRAGRMATLTTWQQFNSATGLGIAGSATTRWNYNARGLLANKRYADDKGPSYTYTAGGKLKTRRWARGVLTTYGYDPQAGDLLTVTYSDATPGVTNTYDRLGRLASVADASGLRTLGYRNGKTVTEAYGPGLFQGLTLVRDYDDLDRQSALSVTSPTGPIYHVTYGYDAASRLNTVTSGTDVALYTYHPDSDLVHTLTQSHGNAVRLTTTKLYDKLGRLQSITSVPSADNPISFAYDYNDANQRTRTVQANGEYWTYGYDALGQVTNGVKRFSTGVPIPGYSFGYQFDQIGNRLSATRESQTDTYTNNVLNQIESIAHAPWLHVLGALSNNATVTVNGKSAVRTNGYFYAQVLATNSWNTVSIQAALPGLGGTPDALAEDTGHLRADRGQDLPRYDADGNLLSDGQWTMTWDAENRVVRKETLRALPERTRYWLDYTVDSQGRRVLSSIGRATDLSAAQAPHRYLADDFELIAELDAEGNQVRRGYVWGLDLSDTRSGVGGVGGLLQLEAGRDRLGGTYLSAFDGNGSIRALIHAESGKTVAQYEYDSFGRLLRATGASSNVSPFGYSTKWREIESSHIHYEHRDYSPFDGRWLSRDPLGELSSAPSLYAFVSNDPMSKMDLLGLYEIDFHFYAIYFLLRCKCFEDKGARLIAHASQSVDDDQFSDPLTLGALALAGLPGEARQLIRYHFPGSNKSTKTKQNSPEAYDRVYDAMEPWRTARQGGTTWQSGRLGVALHTYADSWAHEGYTGVRTYLGRPNRFLRGRVYYPLLFPNWWEPIDLNYWTVGHLDDGHDPDEPFRNPGKALQAAKAIYDLIPCQRPSGKCRSWDSIRKGLSLQFSTIGSAESRSISLQSLIQSMFKANVEYTRGGYYSSPKYFY